MKSKITKRIVDAARGEDRDRFIWDTEVKGFGLKVTPSGGKVYVLQYRPGGRGAATRRITIGRHGSPWTPEKARSEAQRLLELVAAGEDPAPRPERPEAGTGEAESPAPATTEPVAPSAMLLEDVVADFLERHHRARGNRSVYDVERAFKRDVFPTWGKRPITEITRRDAVELIDGIAARAPVLANRTLAYVRKFFNWCVERDLLAISPCAGVRAPSRERPRDRVLSDGELAEIWRACDRLGWPFGPAVQLLILTAQRRDEVAWLRWSEIDLDGALWTLPRERAKNDRAHEVPLSKQAVALLRGLPRPTESDLVFTTTGETPVSGFSHAKDRLDDIVLKDRRKEAGRMGKPLHEVKPIPHWVLHDIRRTVTTGLARRGVPPHIADRILNHVQGAIRGVAAIYNRHGYLDERRAALQDWADHVDRLVGHQVEAAERDGGEARDRPAA